MSLVGTTVARRIVRTISLPYSGARVMTATNVNFDPDELLTEEQLSAKSNISPRTLQGWRIQGKGPRFVKHGRLVRYRAGDYVDWIDENTASSTAEVDARS